MAQLMMCPGCKADIPEGQQYCDSNCFLTPIPKPSTAPVPESPVPADSTAPACGDPDCPYAGRPPATGCRACGEAPATTLHFDWGPVTVTSDRPLVVGRENSPIADRLGPFSNISRQHAEIRSDGTALTVTDLDSMNGTFINDERLAPRQARPVKAGDRVRFAARLEATVTSAATATGETA